MNLQEDFKVTAANDNWSPVTLAIARIIAARPHSCDVEYLVSAYNQLQDPDRCTMSALRSDHRFLPKYLHKYAAAGRFRRMIISPPVYGR